MKRVAKFALIAFLAISGLVFAAALAGGLTDDRAFTQAAKDAAH